MAAAGVASASALKDWNLTTSAPACAAASTRPRAMSSEPLWFTPASAMTSTRGSPMVEEPLLDQPARIAQAAQHADDALGAAAVAVRIHHVQAVEFERAADRFGDRLLLRRAVQHRGGAQPAFLPRADVHRRHVERRRFVEAARGIPDHCVAGVHATPVELLSERWAEDRVGVRRHEG